MAGLLTGRWIVEQPFEKLQDRLLWKRDRCSCNTCDEPFAVHYLCMLSRSTVWKWAAEYNTQRRTGEHSRANPEYMIAHFGRVNAMLIMTMAIDHSHGAERCFPSWQDFYGSEARRMRAHLHPAERRIGIKHYFHALASQPFPPLLALTDHPAPAPAFSGLPASSSGASHEIHGSRGTKRAYEDMEEAVEEPQFGPSGSLHGVPLELGSYSWTRSIIDTIPGGNRLEVHAHGVTSSNGESRISGVSVTLDDNVNYFANQRP
eukprot:TRINITY_DN93621_c0_g1_i1.p1 TRINITY_DN93621_c0_g1~~TRINITY_DN93621_c0_g1_i1.p1  ORF type:complete len:261 (+),score=15.54 TRINITY_DN93621_c0_g1_i1:87-869(+)